MDTVGEEGWKSWRLAWRQEWWLPVGVPIVAVADALWVGLTGAAVTFLAGAVAGSLTVEPWTGLTDLVVVVLALLWVVGPAGLVAVLVRDRVTNVRGNLATGYRLRHPLLLFLPPAAVLAVGAAGLATGGATVPVLVVLGAGAVWLPVRTVAYATRVFSLSLPVAGHAVTFLTAAAASVAGLVLAAGTVGRAALVEDVAAGLAVRTGIEAFADLAGGTVAVAGGAVPAPVATLVAVPVGLSAAYLAVQLLASVVTRLAKPTVRRPELRTGQRYPAFARPTSGSTPTRGSASARSSGAGTAETGASQDRREAAAATNGDGGDDDADVDHAGPVTAPEPDEPSDVVSDVSRTRVFTPPEDASSIDPDAVAKAGPAGSETHEAETCPACGASLSEGDDGPCPHCGAAR